MSTKNSKKLTVGALVLLQGAYLISSQQTIKVDYQNPDDLIC